MRVRAGTIPSNIYLFVGYIVTLSVAIPCRVELINDNL